MASRQDVMVMARVVASIERMTLIGMAEVDLMAIPLEFLAEACEVIEFSSYHQFLQNYPNYDYLGSLSMATMTTTMLDCDCFYCNRPSDSET